MTDLRVIQGGQSPVATLQSVWPANRERGDYRAAVRAHSDSQLRRVYCGRCGARSVLLDGPAGRAWFHHHVCPETA